MLISFLRWLPYQPAVKFWKISKDTLKRLQICTNDKNGNPELEESEDEELENIEEENNMPEFTAPKAAIWVPFKIDTNININLKALLDMIATETEVIEKHDEASQSEPATNPEKRVSVAEAFENW